MIGHIYKITNKLNGRAYIGQTLSADPYKRISAHFKDTGRGLSIIRRATRKYGKEAFLVELLACSRSLTDLNFLEQELIQAHNTLLPNGYNVKRGGLNGGSCTEGLKRKIGRKIKAWYARNVHPFKGKKFSEEHCSALSKVRKGFTSAARQAARLINAQKMAKPVVAVNITTGEEQEFQSIQKCADVLNLVPTCISRTLRGAQNRKQHKGYKFYTPERSA